uniref:glutathione transferase n=1 Tax=Acartia tonsa TaxID=136180 RepID=A0A6G5X4A8_ACATN|nr:GSTM2 [Acartia tonsa]
MSPNVAILGYWDIRGLAETSRLLLEYGGINYEDRRIQMSKADWLEYKTGLGFDFPNLPFYQDEDVKITQSKAIVKHLGRKLNLAGSTLKGQADIDMLLDLVADFVAMTTGLCYSPDFSESLKAEWLAGSGSFGKSGPLADRLKSLQDKLGSNDWFVENQLSIADFSLWEFLDETRLLFAGCLDGFDGLQAFMDRFEQLKGVKEYLNSPRYRAFPIWSVRAKYGYNKV